MTSCPRLQPSLRPLALKALCLTDPADKVQAVMSLQMSPSSVDTDEVLTEPPGLPGRPSAPRLVPHVQLARRSPHTREGRAALLHAVAHIEFNAINLALDACWRFAGMPEAYYRQWLQVAAEEAQHFGLLSQHLQSLACRYGDFDAHDGLWQMVERTKHDITARMALVPRTLEARGLDATPPMQAKFARVGDTHAVEILGIILRDEIGHVAIGNRWFRWLCEHHNLDPLKHYAHLADLHDAPRPRPPFNLDARERAGFQADELQALIQVSL